MENIIFIFTFEVNIKILLLDLEEVMDFVDEL